MKNFPEFIVIHTVRILDAGKKRMRIKRQIRKMFHCLSQIPQLLRNTVRVFSEETVLKAAGFQDLPPRWVLNNCV